MLITVSDSQHLFFYAVSDVFIHMCVYIFIKKKFMYKYVLNCFYNMIKKASFSQHLSDAIWTKHYPLREATILKKDSRKFM